MTDEEKKEDKKIELEILKIDEEDMNGRVYHEYIDLYDGPGGMIIELKE